MPFKSFHIISFCAVLLTAPAAVYAQIETAPPPASKGDVVEIQPAPAGQVPPPGMAGVNILPAKSLSTEQYPDLDPDDPTHPELRLTPDKSEIVRLDTEVGTVIVGNPNHISIMAENTKTLVLAPKMPGATYFVALDGKGNVLMQRHVIVASPKEKYVRIRKSCAGSTSKNCQATQVYYCPDMCHEIMTGMTQEGGKSSPPEESVIDQANAVKDAAGAMKEVNESFPQPTGEGNDDPVQ